MCDVFTRVLYISIGVNGNRHNAYAYSMYSLASELQTISEAIEQDQVNLSTDLLHKTNQWNGLHIICDSTFPASTIISKPIPGGSLSIEQKEFNMKLRQRRIRIEHCFAQVKTSFPVIQIKMHTKNYTAKAIYAAFALHNFIISSLLDERLNENQRHDLFSDEQKAQYKNHMLESQGNDKNNNCETFVRDYVVNEEFFEI